MTVQQTFALGLEVTGWGMGVVFLTLLLVAAVTWGLDRAFRPRSTPEAAGPAPAKAPAEAPSAVQEIGSDLSDQVAALAVALALQRRAAAPRARPRVDVVDGPDLVGEVVTVNFIDPGPGIWKSRGRLKAMQ